MAITNQLGIISANPPVVYLFHKASAVPFGASQYTSMWRATGSIPAGATAAATGTVMNGSTTGGISIFNSQSGNTHLAQMGLETNQFGTVILYDRLWASEGLNGTLTTAQTFTAQTLTRPDANGTDVEAWLEVYTALGATGTTGTLTYTNQAGTTGKTANVNIPANASANFITPFNLASGDTGIRSVASIALAASTGTAGSFGITLMRRIAELPYVSTGSDQSKGNVIIYDWMALGLPFVYSDSCLAFMVLAGVGTGTGQLHGWLKLVSG